MRWCLPVALFIFLLWPETLPGQEMPGVPSPSYSNLRVRQIVAEDTLLRLDTLAVFPHTFRLHYEDGRPVPENLYQFSPRMAFLSLHPSLMGQILQVSYRVTQINPTDTLQRYVYNPSFFFIDSEGMVYDPFYRRATATPQALFDFGGLNYSGSFARGFSFGNNQNLTVNGALDLQLSGRFGNDLEITAAISDNNIPIQPDGTTAQIQDFDKVYIRVAKDRYELVAGDYDIYNADNYFLRVSKQLQGGSFRASFPLKDSLTLQSTASFAVAKGKFSRNTFNGIENNQGPYRLRGALNETFIIILAGSERVYADGVRLQRGEDNDYIMDYNTAEITFTPKFLVTKDVRLVVEFEYAEKNYFRSMVYSSHLFTGKKWKAGLGIYTEQDAKNRPIQADLTDEIQAIMGGLGNNSGSAFVPSIREEVFDPDRIFYKMIDTLVGAAFYDSVFVYSTNPDSARFRLNFSYLGPGQGNYIPAQSAANGRVYRWVAPVNGIPQGSYEPVVLLNTPKKEHYLAFHGEYRPDARTAIEANLILGNKDPNTFSSLDNEQNKGLGGSIGLRRSEYTGREKGVTLHYGARYEYLTRYFSPLEPYRPVEFSRDWNLPADTVAEHWVQAHFEAFRGGKWRNLLQVSTFQRPGAYSGYQQRLEHHLHAAGWEVRAMASILNTRSGDMQSSFLRPEFRVAKWLPILKNWQLGILGNMERNLYRSFDTDTLLPLSFQNQTIGSFFRTSDSSWVVTGVQYRYRADMGEDNGGLNKLTSSHTFEWDGSFPQLNRQALQWNVTYRRLQVLDTARVKISPENTALGRVEYRGRTRKGVFNYNVLYELGSGQERVREFVFLEVPPGQGLYKWVDENGDGIRQENEYVISQFSDSAIYIKVLTDINEYIQARVVAFNQTWQLMPRAVWFDAKGIKGILGRFMLQSSMQLRRKSLPGSGVAAFNPFVFSSSDSAIVSTNSGIRQSVIYNSGDPVYGASYNWIFNQDKILQVNGFDSRQRSEQIWEGRYTPARISTITLLLAHGRNRYTSEFFLQNSFDIRFYRIEPGVTFYYKTIFRTGLTYGYSRKNNDPILGGETVGQHKLSTDFRFAKAGNIAIDGKVTFARVLYNGINGTTKAYQLLEGLQPGQNLLWQCNMEKKLAGFMQISLGYEGRKTGTAKSVHTGRAGVRVIF